MASMVIPTWDPPLDPEYRRLSCYVRQMGVRAVPALLKCLRDGRRLGVLVHRSPPYLAWTWPSVFVCDVIELLRQADGKGVEQHLLSLLHDPDPDVRVAAVWGLRDSGSPAALPALAELAADTSPNVRASAVVTRAYLGDPSVFRAIPAIRKQPAYLPDLAEALGGLRDCRSGPLLLELLEWSLAHTDSVHSWATFLATVEALGRLAAPGTEGLLQKALRDRDYKRFGPVDEPMPGLSVFSTRPPCWSSRPRHEDGRRALEEALRRLRASGSEGDSFEPSSPIIRRP
jgi:hypothetical protein